MGQVNLAGQPPIDEIPADSASAASHDPTHRKFRDQKTKATCARAQRLRSSIGYGAGDERLFSNIKLAVSDARLRQLPCPFELIADGKKRHPFAAMR